MVCKSAAGLDCGCLRAAWILACISTSSSVNPCAKFKCSALAKLGRINNISTKRFLIEIGARLCFCVALAGARFGAGNFSKLCISASVTSASSAMRLRNISENLGATICRKIGSASFKNCTLSSCELSGFFSLKCCTIYCESGIAACISASIFSLPNSRT